METYYKAVRPDGTDFRTSSVDYAGRQGQWLPELPHVDNPWCCTSDVYHVSTSKADTLIGGSWPCRLFEVEAEAVAEEDNKRGVYTMRIVRELPAWEALGPNGEAVAALIEKARMITPGRAGRLADGWNAARTAARTAAWNAAWGAARVAVRGAAWDAARTAAWNAAWDAARYATRDAAWNAAWDVARDAAEALVVRDLITPEQFDILYGPWASVMDSE